MPWYLFLGGVCPPGLALVYRAVGFHTLSSAYNVIFRFRTEVKNVRAPLSEWKSACRPRPLKTAPLRVLLPGSTGGGGFQCNLPSPLLSPFVNAPPVPMPLWGYSTFLLWYLSVFALPLGFSKKDKKGAASSLAHGEKSTCTFSPVAKLNVLGGFTKYACRRK